jgi:hypothetical protein
MKDLTAAILFLTLSIQASAQPGSEINFPNAYFGIYKGELHIALTGGPSIYPMEFHLQPTDTIGKYTYTLVYGAGDEQQWRNYTLLATDAAKGDYVVDENNGIFLDVKVLGNRMYSLFEVQGTLLTTIITFEEDQMVFEIVAARKESPRTSFAENEEKTEVVSYPITTVQRAVLIKQ